MNLEDNMENKFRVKIIVLDEDNIEIERNYNYQVGATDFTKEVDDMVDSHSKSKLI